MGCEGYSIVFGGAEPFISALDRGVAFQRLRTLDMPRFKLKAAQWDRLLHALAGATCASQLTSLQLKNSNLCPVSMATLSELLSQDLIHQLQDLSFYYNASIGDNGVAPLVQGLLTAPHTRLTGLNLQFVSMGDKGMAAIASLITTGRFEQLVWISVSHNEEATDRGICVFARALQAAGNRGLPVLATLYATELPQVTGLGVGLLAQAAIKSCPRLTNVWLYGTKKNNEGLPEVAEGMVQDAGRKHLLASKV